MWVKVVNEGFYKIAVSTPCWAETKKHWCLLTIQGATKGSWYQDIWFAKDKCILNPEGFITIPVWYYRWLFRGKEKPEVLNHQ